MKKKLVSIIIPTYSRPTNLKRAIDSVLSQTYSNIEIVVVDDNGEGCTEQLETEQIVSEYSEVENIYYLKHLVNKNGSAARNTGIHFCHGEYIGFLDDDDEFLPLKIEIQVAALERNDESFGGCYCNLNLIGRYQRILKNSESGNLTEGLLLGNIRFNSTTLLLRRDVCFELNGFDESFVRHQDWEFMIRFFRKYKLYLPTQDCLANKYSSYNNLSNLPNGIVYIQLKHKFFKTFKVDIDSLSAANKIYHKHWMSVASTLLGNRQYKLFYRYFSLANTFQRFSCNDVKSLLKSFLHSLI